MIASERLVNEDDCGLIAANPGSSFEVSEIRKHLHKQVLSSFDCNGGSPTPSFVMDQEVQYIGSYTPYKEFTLKTQPRKTTRIYISTQLPTSDIGDSEVGDLCIRRVKRGCDPAAVELFWKGFRKDGIQMVWREVQQNKPLEIQHPLHPTLYLRGFPACPLRPEWCEKSSRQHGQGDLKLSAVLYLRTYETGSWLNPIELSNSNLSVDFYGNGTSSSPIDLS